MAPSKQAKKEAAKLELQEDEERFPRLNDTNRSEYEIVAEIDNDLQVMVDQGVLGPDESVDVARNVFIPHRQGTHKTTGDRLFLLWYGYLAPHKKRHMQLKPGGQTKFRVRFRDGYNYMFKREEMMYSIPENIPFRINDGVEVPSDGTSDYGEECDDKDEESSNSEYDALCNLHAPIVHTARRHCAHCTHALCVLHARIVHTARTHALCTLHARIVYAASTHCAHCTHARTVHTARRHCARCTHALFTLHGRIVKTARTHCAHCTHTLCAIHCTQASCTLHARTVQAARRHRAHCTHAFCTLHAGIVHAARTSHCVCIVQTARTYCAHCTHPLCTLHAHIVHTTLHARTVHAARTHCAHCTHALCTLHARIVHTARTRRAHCTHALCTLHAGTHCAHCTHALSTLHAHTVNICTVHTDALCIFHTRTVNMRTVHTVSMHCAHCTVLRQDLCIYLILLVIPGNIPYGACVLACSMEASWIRKEIPLLFGSMETVLFNLILVFQIILFGKPSSKPLLAIVYSSMQCEYCAWVQECCAL